MKVKRVYTGYVPPSAKGLQAGTRAFIDRVVFLSGGALWDNGNFAVRPMRGKQSMSVHATGRAVDFSYRRIDGKGKPHGRRHALNWMRILSQNADKFGIEMIIDYFPQPHGRAWKCDRGTWLAYSEHTVTGAPSGDWVHIEISPEFASNSAKMIAAFVALFPAPIV